MDERERRPRCVAKFAAAQLEGVDEIEIWGDGEHTRSFCSIDDCVITFLAKVYAAAIQITHVSNRYCNGSHRYRWMKGSDAPTIGSRTGHRIGFRYSFVIATFPPLPEPRNG